MKKLLSIFVLCIAFLATNAQVAIWQEGFESENIPSTWVTVDSDGDSYNWHTLYGDDYATWSHSGIGHITSASYQGAALTPDNWLITEGISIPADANEPVFSWWAKAQDPAYPSENYAVYISTTGQAVENFTSSTPVYEGVPTGDYVQYSVDIASYVGQTIYVAFRHYNVTDMFRLNIDDIAVIVTTDEPMIVTNVTDLDFGTIVANNAAQLTATVTAYNLTEGITATTTAPFAVSLDGTSFSTSVTMPAEGGTLYVQFAPTTAGAATGTVALASGNTTATINLAGSAIECNTITTLPYTCTFAEDDATLNCWQIIDANGDANAEGENMGTWAFYGADWSADNDGVAQYFYAEQNAADDWLISPEITLGENTSVSFNYMVRSSTYPESFEVYVIAQGQTYQNATEVLAAQTYTNEEFEQHTISLSDYNNQTVKIAIHASSDANTWGIVIDDFTVSATGTDITENAANSLSIYPNPATTILNVEAEGYSTIELVNVLGQVVYSNNITENMQINVSNLNNGVYFVRLNGANGTTTQKFIKK